MTAEEMMGRISGLLDAEPLDHETLFNLIAEGVGNAVDAIDTARLLFHIPGAAFLLHQACESSPELKLGLLNFARFLHLVVRGPEWIKKGDEFEREGGYESPVIQ